MSKFWITPFVMTVLAQACGALYVLCAQYLSKVSKLLTISQTLPKAFKLLLVILEVLSQILIKFHLHNLDQASTSKSQPTIGNNPVSTMQKTGCTNYSPFLILSGLEKCFTLDMNTMGQSTSIFLFIWPFSTWNTRTNDQTNKQPDDPECKPALEQCKKAVFCKI